MCMCVQVRIKAPPSSTADKLFRVIAIDFFNRKKGMIISEMKTKHVDWQTVPLDCRLEPVGSDNFVKRAK